MKSDTANYGQKWNTKSYFKEVRDMNEENITQNTQRQQEPHQNTKLNRQADVLDLTRLRPPRLDHGHFHITRLFPFPKQLATFQIVYVSKAALPIPKRNVCSVNVSQLGRWQCFLFL